MLGRGAHRGAWYIGTLYDVHACAWTFEWSSLIYRPVPFKSCLWGIAPCGVNTDSNSKFPLGVETRIPTDHTTLWKIRLQVHELIPGRSINFNVIK